jgi:hypothetical protein
VRRRRADDDRVSLLPNPGEPRDAANVDEVRGLREAQLEDRDQAVPAGQQLRVVAVAAEELQRVVDRRGRVILE